MTYPNAYKGVKKLFSAHVLYLIAAILLVAGVMYICIANNLITSEGFDAEALNAMTADTDAAVKGFGIGSIPILAGVVLVIWSYILGLIGMGQAGKDEGAFKAGFWFSIIALVAAVALGLLIKEENKLVSTVSTVATSIVVIIVQLCIATGVKKLSEKLGEAGMVSRGKTLVTLLVIALIAAIALGVLTYFFPTDTESTIGVILSCCTGAASLFGVVIFFMLLGYLGKAKKMLKAH